MALADTAPKDHFRLSMLIYDTRFRALTIQVIVLVLFGLFVSWLLNNTIENLAAKGKTFSFDFLWVRAGYDIEQRLIEYTNDSSHGRALIVGLLNTLLVAVIGCVLATIIGVIVGVLRLSRNWLIARIMTVYVEIFRNIPVLLWILFIFVPLSEIAPEPREFKVTQEMIDTGTAPAASKILFDSVAVTTRGVNLPAPVLTRPLGAIYWDDIPINLSVLAFLAIVGGSIWANRVMRRRARRLQEDTGLRPVLWWKSLLILLAPSVLLLAAMGFHLEIPAFPANEAGVSQGFNFQGGLAVQHSFVALTLALALYTGAFIAEIVRAGILAISRGQTEAAFALGLRPGRTMSLIILPQALRVIIPPLISQFLNLTKNSSLGIAVSYLDLRGTLGGITLNQTGRELECMLLMMLIYLTISLSISSVMNFYNRSVQLKAR